MKKAAVADSKPAAATLRLCAAQQPAGRGQAVAEEPDPAQRRRAAEAAAPHDPVHVVAEHRPGHAEQATAAKNAGEAAPMYIHIYISIYVPIYIERERENQ